MLTILHKHLPAEKAKTTRKTVAKCFLPDGSSPGFDTRLLDSRQGEDQKGDAEQ